MLGTILRLYVAGMAHDVRSPMPHLYGPPGSGKSTVVQQAADLLGVNLHIINVSRISPLELEGVQMPLEGKLELLLSTYWNALKPGDIVLFDEFLRGFPEVYNGLLDIFTSRSVAGHALPKVFFIGASNSVIAYDQALTDRLLHIPVADPRKSQPESLRIRKTIVGAIGLLPDMVDSPTMHSLMDEVIYPTYKMMDSFGAALTSVAPAVLEGLSPRNLIGQAKLRYVTCPQLAELLNENNRRAGKQYDQYVKVYMYKGRMVGETHTDAASCQQLLDSGKLSPAQVADVQLNLELLNSAEVLKKEEEVTSYDDIFDV